MRMPSFVLEDLKYVQESLSPFVKHFGVFGSIRNLEFSDVGDVDVLCVYEGTAFEYLRDSVRDMALALPVTCSYMNYGCKIESPPETGKYYDFVFMPRDKPDRDFMAFHDGAITYFTEPFEAWRKGAVLVIP